MSLSGKDIYDGEFSRRAPILRKAAQHFESIFGVLIKLKSLVCYFCVAKVHIIFQSCKKTLQKNQGSRCDCPIVEISPCASLSRDDKGGKRLVEMTREECA